MKVNQRFLAGDLFEEYIDWRAEHPSDDLMTELLTAEFEDESGKLARSRVRRYSSTPRCSPGAGNETTGRLIGWLGKVLAEHPDQRRELVEDRSLIPNTIEETLRFEPTGPHVGPVRRSRRRVLRHDRAGREQLCSSASANRDERHYERP